MMQRGTRKEVKSKKERWKVTTKEARRSRKREGWKYV